jgi:hypothetical protein
MKPTVPDQPNAGHTSGATDPKSTIPVLPDFCCAASEGMLPYTAGSSHKTSRFSLLELLITVAR